LEQVVIEEVEPAILERLKLRALQSGRPLQAELRSILEMAAECDWLSVSPELQRVQAHFAGKSFSDSLGVLQEERAK
jgi:plasmid stability protein